MHAAETVPLSNERNKYNKKMLSVSMEHKAQDPTEGNGSNLKLS
jgi:hypothetical protein